MTPVNAVVIYIVIWWCVLFMVLPFGVRRADAPEPGHDPGAPQRPMIARKMAITTLIAAVLFLILYAVVESGLVGLRDLMLHT